MWAFEDPINPVVGCFFVVEGSVLDVVHRGLDLGMSEPLFDFVFIEFFTVDFCAYESCDGTPMSAFVVIIFGINPLYFFSSVAVDEHA